jgi:hypothetical protein
MRNDPLIATNVTSLLTHPLYEPVHHHSRPGSRLAGAANNRIRGHAGVVSLGAALYIPVLAVNEQPLPYRNLILFFTFIVILITLFCRT